MTELGITLAGQTFEHLVYHFVLTYSNWETGTICYSESLESLSEVIIGLRERWNRRCCCEGAGTLQTWLSTGSF